jgi:hypothetical protein
MLNLLPQSKKMNKEVKHNDCIGNWFKRIITIHDIDIINQLLLTTIFAYNEQPDFFREFKGITEDIINKLKSSEFMKTDSNGSHDISKYLTEIEFRIMDCVIILSISNCPNETDSLLKQKFVYIDKLSIIRNSIIHSFISCIVDYKPNRLTEKVSLTVLLQRIRVNYLTGMPFCCHYGINDTHLNCDCSFTQIKE